MFMLLGIFITGAGAARKGDARAELVADGQIAMTNMTQDIERAPVLGVSVAPDNQGLAVLSALDESGAFELDDEGKPLWSRWAVYYHENGELKKTYVDWTASPSVRATPIPLEQLDASRTVADYETGGRVLARNVYAVDMRVLPNTTTSLRLELHKKRYGRQDPEKVVMETVVKARNP